MDALVHSCAAECPLQLELLLLLLVQPAGGDFRGLQEGGDDMLIAVQTDHFFRHILPALHVLTVSRDLKSKNAVFDLRLHIQGLHDAENVLFRHGDAEDIGDAAHLDGQSALLDAVAGIHFAVGTGNLAGAKLLHQVQGSLHRHDSGILIHTLLVAGGSVSSLSQRPGGAADVVAGKFGGFEDDLCCFRKDLGVQTAHDAGHAHRLLGVDDQQVGRIQRIFVSVQRDHLLAVFRAARHEVRSCDMVPVIGMHGLTQLQQDKVRDVHDVGNGVQAGQGQAALHPCGRFLDLHVVDVVAQEPLAEFRRVDPHMEAREFDICLFIIQRRLLQRLIQHCRDFPRDAEDALAVRTVRGDGNIKEPVVQSDDRLYIRSDRRILRQKQKSVVACAGIKILRDAEFHTGTKHSLGFISPELAFLDGHHAFHSFMVLCGGVDCGAHQRCREFLACFHIVRAAADLESPVLSAVHCAHMKMRLRNSITGLHKAYHDVGNILS